MITFMNHFTSDFGESATKGRVEDNLKSKGMKSPDISAASHPPPHSPEKKYGQIEDYRGIYRLLSYMNKDKGSNVNQVFANFSASVKKLIHK
jgi:rRNA maturation protein Nop10